MQYLRQRGERKREPIVGPRRDNQVRRPHMGGWTRCRQDILPVASEIYALALRSFKKRPGFTP